MNAPHKVEVKRSVYSGSTVERIQPSAQLRRFVLRLGTTSYREAGRLQILADVQHVFRERK